MTVTDERRTALDIEREETLVERYARMAHTFERRPVDHVLRALDVGIAAVALLVLNTLRDDLQTLYNSAGEKINDASDGS